MTFNENAILWIRLKLCPTWLKVVFVSAAEIKTTTRESCTTSVIYMKTWGKELLYLSLSMNEILESIKQTQNLNIYKDKLKVFYQREFVIQDKWYIFSNFFISFYWRGKNTFSSSKGYFLHIFFFFSCLLFFSYFSNWKTMVILYCVNCSVKLSSLHWLSHGI